MSAFITVRFRCDHYDRHLKVKCLEGASGERIVGGDLTLPTGWSENSYFDPTCQETVKEHFCPKHYRK